MRRSASVICDLADRPSPRRRSSARRGRSRSAWPCRCPAARTARCCRRRRNHRRRHRRRPPPAGAPGAGGSGRSGCTRRSHFTMLRPALLRSRRSRRRSARARSLPLASLIVSFTSLASAFSRYASVAPGAGFMAEEQPIALEALHLIVGWFMIVAGSGSNTNASALSDFAHCWIGVEVVENPDAARVARQDQVVVARMLLDLVDRHRRQVGLEARPLPALVPADTHRPVSVPR